MGELESQLKEKVEDLMDRSNEEYDKGNYIGSINLLESSWNMLPDSKGIYDESFHIVRYICETYLLINNVGKAKEWADRIFQCDLNRIDSGEREFLAGKVAFESGEFESARSHFSIANEKSDGRCFEDEDIKYFNFFKK